MIGASTAAMISATTRRARSQQPTVRIGVLTALSGEYTDAAGYGSVVATKLAIDDFMRDHKPGFKVEVVEGDMLDKPDIGASVARRWFDQDGVDAVSDVPNSAIGQAVATIIREKNKVGLFGGPTTSALIGTACSPNHIMTNYNTWALASAVGNAVIARGGNTWFFITADYTFGRQLQSDATAVVTAAGGKVLGSAAFPFPDTTDYSSFLLSAQASKAKVIGLATAGGNTTNILKQAAEFRITDGGQSLAGLLLLIFNVHAIGLKDAQGLLLADTFYWDKSDATRAFTKRFAPLYRNLVPGSVHAAAYSGALNYLKAVATLGPEKAKADGRAVIADMKSRPMEDSLFGSAPILANGCVAHDLYLYRVKSPAESKQPWDYYTQLSMIPGSQAFKSADKTGCPLVTN